MTGLFGCESPRTAGKGVMLPVESSRLDIRSHRFLENFMCIIIPEAGSISSELDLIVIA
jgi:hypothetical protein